MNRLTKWTNAGRQTAIIRRERGEETQKKKYSTERDDATTRRWGHTRYWLSSLFLNRRHRHRVNRRPRKVTTSPITSPYVQSSSKRTVEPPHTFHRKPHGGRSIRSPSSTVAPRAQMTHLSRNSCPCSLDHKHNACWRYQGPRSGHGHCTTDRTPLLHGR